MNKPVDETFLRATAATLRALAGGTQHEVRYIGNDSQITNEGVRLPAPPTERTKNAENQMRGASDAAGLWLAHHNKITHQKVRPKSSAANMIFEAAEKGGVLTQRDGDRCSPSESGNAPASGPSSPEK